MNLQLLLIFVLTLCLAIMAMAAPEKPGGDTDHSATGGANRPVPSDRDGR